MSLTTAPVTAAVVESVTGVMGKATAGNADFFSEASMMKTAGSGVSKQKVVK